MGQCCDTCAYPPLCVCVCVYVLSGAVSVQIGHVLHLRFIAIIMATLLG